jgi:serine/threonine-protein kinase RsbW
LKKAATYHKKLSASTENLSLVRNFVSSQAKKHGFTEGQINDIRLAVDEACTNVIKHAYSYDDTKDFNIDLNFNRNGVSIEIIDFGIGFDPTKYEVPNLQERIKQKKRGGVGIFLIQSLMDELSYDSDGDKNVIRMIKYRN